jgi:uncharacterized protein (TIGR02757 family)
MSRVTGFHALKPALDRLYDEFDEPDVVADPIWVVRRYPDPADREVVAFVGSALAFGRVRSVLRSIGRVLDVMGSSPAMFVRAFDPRRDRRRFDHLGHRWIRGRDLAALAWVLGRMVDSARSIEGFFTAGLDEHAADVGPALESFSARARAIDLAPIYGRGARKPGVHYFLPRPSTGSACKRLNLFLRWMVRRDRVDPGGWTRVPASKLVVPLDTHVVRVGRCLGLTRYRSPGWRMAADITASLRTLDATDPVKYDFSLCHIGMLEACRFGRPTTHTRRCPIEPLCRPGRAQGARCKARGQLP